MKISVFYVVTPCHLVRQVPMYSKKPAACIFIIEEGIIFLPPRRKQRFTPKHL